MNNRAKLLCCAAVLVGCASCASPSQVAGGRCAALGLDPGTTDFAMCYEHELDRSAAANAALINAGVGLYQASQPRYGYGW